MFVFFSCNILMLLNVLMFYYFIEIWPCAFAEDIARFKALFSSYVFILCHFHHTNTSVSICGIVCCKYMTFCYSYCMSWCRTCLFSHSFISSMFSCFFFTRNLAKCVRTDYGQRVRSKNCKSIAELSSNDSFDEESLYGDLPKSKRRKLAHKHLMKNGVRKLSQQHNDIVSLFQY